MKDHTMISRGTTISLSLVCPVLLGAVLLISADPKASEAWHHLSPRQLEHITQTLAPTHLRPIAPAYLPPGFRVTFTEADASVRYSNGDYDPGFRIDYRGPDNRCFGLSATKSGPRGLLKVTTVQSALGPIEVYRDAYRRAEDLTAFIPDQPILLATPGYANPTDPSDCKPVSLAEFMKITESLRWLVR